MIRVGLTGGIACGKSTVARLLREKGVPVLDLDQVSRQVVEAGTPGFVAIAEKWPSVVKNGHIDRKALGKIAVDDVHGRRALEAIVHPLVWAECERWLSTQAAAGAPAAVVEAALMVETGSYRHYDRLLVVSASAEVQRQRLAAREGYDAATVEKWLATQYPLAEKEAVATVVIRNDGGVDALNQATEAAWAKLSAPDFGKH